MTSKSIIVVLCAVCLILSWKLAARPAPQGQSLTLANRPLVISDTDVQLLRQDLRAQKQKLIAQNLPMTESEAVKLWAVYKRYTDELRPINDEKFRLIKQYGDEWGTITDDQALIYIRRWLEVDAQAHELRSKYVLDVSHALPGKKAATFFQLDRRLSMMMDLQLTSQLPLVIQEDKQP
jgi:hypothetical protein